MPIEYQIDHDRRLVTAQGRGVFTHDDVMRYQHEVWTRPDVAGYDELVDMTAVTRIDATSVDGVRQLAAVAAAMDDPDAYARFAIVAPQDIAYGLGRMYETYRGLDTHSTKDVAVFRTAAEALAWLRR
jgi:hypothetical protein